MPFHLEFLEIIMLSGNLRRGFDCTADSSVSFRFYLCLEIPLYLSKFTIQVFFAYVHRALWDFYDIPSSLHLQLCNNRSMPRLSPDVVYLTYYQSFHR